MCSMGLSFSERFQSPGARAGEAGVSATAYYEAAGYMSGARGFNVKVVFGTRSLEVSGVRSLKLARKVGRAIALALSGYTNERK